MTCQPLASSSSFIVYNEDELEICSSGMCDCESVCVKMTKWNLFSVNIFSFHSRII